MEKISNIIFTEPQFNEQLSAWIEHIPFAFFLIEKLNPKKFVELGIKYGNSYFAFCQAISQLKLPSKAYGVDVWMSYDEGLLNGHRIFEYANQINSKHFSHFSNLLLMTFDEALEYFNDGTIDLLHIDGMHDFASVKHDFETWLPKMSDAGVIILHDSIVRENAFGVWKLVGEINALYPNFSFSFGKGLTVVCIGKNVPGNFIQFVKEAENDSFLNQLFKAIGTQWFLKNQLGLQINNSNKTITQLNEKITHLENQLKEKESVVERLNKRYSDYSLKNEATNPGLRTYRNGLMAKIKKWSAIWKINKSGLFDEKFYLQHNPDVRAANMKPLEHYLFYGGFEGRNPSEKFDSVFYLEQNPDVKASGMNPLVHYLRFGSSENRKLSKRRG